MGQIATMLTSVTRTRSPLQKELGSLTKVLGPHRVGRGRVHRGRRRRPRRGRSATCCCSARRWRSRRSRPACRRSSPGCSRMGAKQLADAKAVVKNLTDVETLGATSAINTDKTGTLTMNQMMVSTIYAAGSWFTVEGEGYRKTGAITVGRRRAGARLHAARARARARQRRDGRRRRRGGRRPDRGGARRARGQARRRRGGDAARLPAARRGAVRLRLQVHGHLPPRDASTGPSASIELVKGGPDVVLARCSLVGRPAERLAGADRRGPCRASTPRTSGWARRACACWPSPRGSSRTTSSQAMADDPMSLTHDLAFVGMVGIIDPLRAEAEGGRPDRARRRHRRAHDHRRPRRHRAGDRRDARARPGRDQRRRAAGAVRRGARAPAPRAARLRPRHAAGQAPPRPADAGAGADRRDDRRRRQRRRRAQAGRHRRGDGQRQRGHQAGGPDDPHRRQLRHARARGRDRPPGLRQGRLLRPLPDDPAARRWCCCSSPRPRSTSTRASR